MKPLWTFPLLFTLILALGCGDEEKQRQIRSDMLGPDGQGGGAPGGEGGMEPGGQGGGSPGGPGGGGPGEGEGMPGGPGGGEFGGGPGGGPGGGEFGGGPGGGPGGGEFGGGPGGGPGGGEFGGGPGGSQQRPQPVRLDPNKPPAPQLNWGVNTGRFQPPGQDIRTIYMGKKASIIIKAFGRPTDAKAVGSNGVWTYPGMKIRDAQGKTYNAVQFTIQPTQNNDGKVIAVAVIPGAIAGGGGQNAGAGPGGPGGGPGGPPGGGPGGGPGAP